MNLVQARVIDSTHLELSKPIDLPLGRNVMVSVTEAPLEVDERDQWHSASATTLEDAYGASEPDYSLEMLNELNPGFAR